MFAKIKFSFIYAIMTIRQLLWIAQYEIKRLALHVRYGKKIPYEVFDRVLSPSKGEVPILLLTIGALLDVCKKLQIDPKTTHASYFISCAQRMDYSDEKEFEEATHILGENEHRRKVIFNTLIKYNDVTEAKVNFLYPGEKLVKFNQWLSDDNMLEIPE